MFKKLFVVGFSLLFLQFTLKDFLSAASQDVPVGDWKYEALERLALSTGCNQFGFSTKPWTEEQMNEMLHCIKYKGDELAENEHFLLDRLRGELEFQNGSNHDSHILKGKYIGLKGMKNQLLLSDADYFKENNFGDRIREDVGTRSDVTLEGMFSNDLLYSVTPRLTINSRDGSVDSQLLFGNIRCNLQNFEVTLGRQSLWLGSGFHGSWVLTNNAFPMDGVKMSHTRPFRILFFRRIKTTLFWGKLSKQVLQFSDFSGNIVTKVVRPQYIVLRGEASLAPWLEGGLTISSLAAGKFTSVGLREIWRAVFPVDIRETSRETFLDTSLAATDRLGSIDFTVKIPRPDRWIDNASALKLYWERGAEDYKPGKIDRFTWLYGFGVPADQIGLYLAFPGSDFRLEYASDVHGVVKWYTHGLFTEGYTNRRNVLGHHMGGQARGMFYRVNHALRDKQVAGLEMFRIKTLIPGVGLLQNQEKWRFDMRFFGNYKKDCGFGYEFYRSGRTNGTQWITRKNHLLFLNVTQLF